MMLLISDDSFSPKQKQQKLILMKQESTPFKCRLCRLRKPTQTMDIWRAFEGCLGAGSKTKFSTSLDFFVAG